jgi:hypothetical protein
MREREREREDHRQRNRYKDMERCKIRRKYIVERLFRNRRVKHMKTKQS